MDSDQSDQPHLLHLIPTLPEDILYHFLRLCPRSTLAALARSARSFNTAVIPHLYRHLDLDVSLPDPLNSTTQSPANSWEPRLHHTRTLRISSTSQIQDPSSVLSYFPASAVNLPNLRSLHIRLDRQTCAWPHSSTLARALFSPGPAELVVSADDGGDVLCWALASRLVDTLPTGVTHLVILMHSNGATGANRASGGRPRNPTRGVGSGAFGYVPKDLVINCISDPNDVRHGVVRAGVLEEFDVQAEQLAVLAILTHGKSVSLFVKGLESATEAGRDIDDRDITKGGDCSIGAVIRAIRNQMQSGRTVELRI